MNVQPKNAPTVASSTTPSPEAQSARERAIAKLTQPSPVPNPTQVSPEEMGAVKASNSEGQSNKSESPQKTESSAPEATKTEEKSDSEPLSTQYAILARKEKALRAKVQAQEQALKAERDAIAKKAAELEAKEKEYQTNYIPKSKLSEDTITTLLEAGITYDQITEMALNQSQVQTDPQTKLALQRLEAQIKSQAEAQERQAKMIQEEQTRQYQQAVNQIRSETRAIVNSDPDFETIKATNSVDDVVELIEKTFKEDGVLITVEEAAREVEEYLVDQALKIAQLKKIQQRLQPKSTPSAQKQVNTQQQPQLKTLTNDLGAAKPLTAKERAILAFKGQLK